MTRARTLAATVTAAAALVAVTVTAIPSAHDPVAATPTPKVTASGQARTERLITTHTLPKSAQKIPSTASLVAATKAAASSSSKVPAGKPHLRSLRRHVATACVGTGSDGNRVQVMYARASGSKSRLKALTPTLRSLTGNIDDMFAVSAAKWGTGKRVRWVTDKSCKVVIKEVVLPKSVLAKSDFGRFAQGLIDKGYFANNRKYLVFADAKAVCGQADSYNDSRHSPRVNENNGKWPMVARIDAPCWLPGKSMDGFAPAHELMHMLGAVNPKAPGATRGMHCTDGKDAMCYKDSRATKVRSICGGQPLFDCRGDTYFNTRPKKGTWVYSHWNTANSSFLVTVPRLR